MAAVYNELSMIAMDMSQDGWKPGRKPARMRGMPLLMAVVLLCTVLAPAAAARSSKGECRPHPAPQHPAHTPSESLLVPMQ